MLLEQRVNKWVKDGLVDEAQADKMIADLRASPPEQLDAAFELEWAQTKTGSLFVFASAILNGLILVVFTWLYDLDVTAHTTFLLWIICILPMVYTLRLGSLAVLLALLFMTWATLFCFRGLETMSIVDRLVQLPALYLICGLTLFAVGGTHYRFKAFRHMARALRLSGLQVTLLSLFGLGVRRVAEGPNLVAGVRDAEATLQISLTTTALALMGIIAALVNVRLKQKGNEDLTRSEGPVVLSLLAVAILFVWVPLPTVIYLIIFGALQVALIAAVLYVGYQRRDLRIISIASLALLIIIGVRYVDLFYSSTSFSTFLVGGLVTLALSAAALELPRRWLGAKIKREAEADAKVTAEQAAAAT
jgi:uncharacterized membrane protein